MIEEEEIVTILDQYPIYKNKNNKKVLDNHQHAGLVVDLGEQSTKSVIITENTLYLSPFSPSTLKRRLGSDKTI